MKERRFIKAINLHVISAIIKPGAAVLRKGSPVPSLCVNESETLTP